MSPPEREPDEPVSGSDSGEPPPSGPRPRSAGRPPRSWPRLLLESQHGAVRFLREALSSVAIVALVGALLFGASGVWPPLVAIESPSMEPHMQTGDLVFIMDEGRLVPAAAVGETGVVTQQAAAQSGYRTFGAGGDVIIFEPGGDGATTPIIHRAMLYVEDGENWYGRAAALDADAVGGADSCAQLRNCPAPHAGFITKGDNTATNRAFDQVSGLTSPVRPAWVIGTAEFRIPLLGNIRLLVSGTLDVPGVQATPSTAHVDGAARENARAACPPAAQSNASRSCSPIVPRAA